MKDSSKRLLIILGSFVLLMGTIYVFFSLLVPAYKDVQSLRAERQAKSELLLGQKEAEVKIGELLKQYESLSKTQEALSLMLPIGARTPSLMNQLQGIARSNFMKLDAISFQYLPISKPAREILDGVGTIRINMTLSGLYSNFKFMVSQLETNVRLLDVHTMRIEGGGVPRQDTLGYNLIVDAYYQE